MPITKVNSSVGPTHCDWQKAHFLSLGEGKKGRLDACDPDAVPADGVEAWPLVEAGMGCA